MGKDLAYGPRGSWPARNRGAADGLAALPPVRLFGDERAVALGAIDIGLAVELLFVANRGDTGLFAGPPFCRGRLRQLGQRAEEEQNQEQKRAKVAHTVQ